MRYSKSHYPPMNKKEFIHFTECLKENWELYINDKYLREYCGYEYVRIIMKMNPTNKELFKKNLMIKVLIS